MRLTQKQRKKFNTIRRNKGKDAAKKYRQGILGGGAQGTSAAQPRVNYNDINSVVSAQQQENQRATQVSTPNVNTHLGSRQVTYGPDGQPIVSEKLSAPEQGLYDQRVQTQQQTNQLTDQIGQRVQQQGAFNPNANQPFQLDPNGFQGMQDRVYGDATARFNRTMQPQFDRQTENLEQQLANRGIAPGSPQYTQMMNDLRNQQSGARENMMSTAYRDSIGAAQGAMNTQLAGNQQVFGQNLASYQLPFQQYQSMLPYAGQYQAPNLGQVQSINAPTTDIAGLGAGMYGQDQQTARTNAQIAAQERMNAADNATRRATGGPGYDVFGLEQLRQQGRINEIMAQGALNVGGLPPQQQTGIDDVMGSLGGGLVSGLIRG